MCLIWSTGTFSERSLSAASIPACSKPIAAYAFTAIRAVSHTVPRPALISLALGWWPSPNTASQPPYSRSNTRLIPT